MNSYNKEILSEKEYNKYLKEPFFPVIAENNSLLFISSKETTKLKIWISDLIIVKKVLKSEKSLEKFFEITVQTKFGEETQIIPTAILNKKDIVVLKKYFNFNEYFSDTLIKYLVQSSENSPHIIKYEEVGWFEYSPNEWFFRTNKVICSDKKISEQYCYDGNMNLDNLISDNEEYLSELNELLNTEGTMFAVVVGLSSALLTLLQKNTSLENILIHIFGDSSSGKTTFLQLAVSMWGKPDSPPLVNEWNSTANAIYSALAGNEGITVGFDEASCCSSLDYSTLIYNLSHGHDKAKCNKDSTLRENQTWHTVIVSTAEESLLDKTKKNNGIRARCLEFFNLKITNDSTHAEKIKNFVMENYGILGEKFVEVIDRKDVDILLNDFYLCRSFFRKNIEDKCNITDRITNTYAVLLQTAFYCKRINIEIDVKKIANVLFEHHKTLVDNTRTAEDLYNCIMEFITANANKFPVKSSTDTYTNTMTIPCLGYMDTKSVFINKTTFKKIIFDAGYTDENIAKKWLFDAGYLKKQEKKFYKMKTINKVSVPCYELILSNKISSTEFKGKKMTSQKNNEKG